MRTSADPMGTLKRRRRFLQSLVPVRSLRPLGACIAEGDLAELSSSGSSLRAGLLLVALSLANFGLLAAQSAPARIEGPLDLNDTSASRSLEKYADWLEEVDPILLVHERKLFESLQEDYQRDAFIREFWRVRDPFERTGRNELKERYLERLSFARGAYLSVDDARARMFLVHGEPARRLDVRCTTTRIPATVWVYEGSEVLRSYFVLIFLRSGNGTGPAQLWRPSNPGAIDSMVRSLRACINGGLFERVIQQAMEQAGDYEAQLDLALLKPRPRSLEWVDAFRVDSARLLPDAPVFPAQERVRFVGRVQSRTVVQWLLTIAAETVKEGEFAGYRSYEFSLIGEIIRDDSLLETFRYKFGVNSSEVASAAGVIPLVFQRNLRPGHYRVVLRLEDLNGQRFYGSDREFTVPQAEGPWVRDSFDDAESAVALFAEATADLRQGRPSIRILEPAQGLQRGFVRFDTLASGSEISAVRFLLDGRSIATKTRPPFQVEIDLGDFPRQRTLRVEAVTDDGSLVAADEYVVNAGAQRFSVRLVSPSGHENGVSSVLADARIALPPSLTLDRLEYFVNDRLVATLYQEPWAQPLRIGALDSPSIVRVVATLVDGSTSEDLIFVNGGNQVGERVDVQLVEVYVAVLDRFGRPIEDLGTEAFRIEEDGVAQEVARFESVKDLPVQYGIVIDTSASMVGVLEKAKRAALRFLQRSVKERDRAAVITFNRVPHLAVDLTNDTLSLGAGLAGLTAQGETALYDSLMYSLYYFSGSTGQRSILLLTDGRDEGSRFKFAETLEFARRAGVAMYIIGLETGEGPERSRLRSLAAETGGGSYFINSIEELEQIYDSIERDLRSQYLLAYQSTNTSRTEEFRSIKVRVRGADTVKAMSGYYP